MPNGTERRKKRRGAVLSALVMVGLLLVVILCMVWDCFVQRVSAAETVVILLCAVLGLLPIGGIVLALVQRLRELEGGEEDEAKKY